MASGTRTFGLHETFAEPQVLPPPPVRHALLVCLAALAAILHFGTAGWSEIHNGAEGLYGTSAKQMLGSDNWLVPRSDGTLAPNEPPLLHWLLLGSFKLFGVSAASARFPIAAAFVVSTALTFLIGERLGGYWRGFTAGLIYLCSCGSYVWARFVTPAPLLTVCIAAAIFCAVAGYQGRRTRRFWFAGFWICAAAAYLTRGAFALVLLAAIMALPALTFREARQRFVSLLHWSAIAAFVIVLAPWVIWIERTHPGTLLRGSCMLPFTNTPIAQQLVTVGISEFAAAHLVWWFPSVLLIAPGLVLNWRNIVRTNDFNFADALPICWVTGGFISFLVTARHESDSLPIWTGFALFAAWVWERTTARLRLAGIVVAGMIGIAACAGISAGYVVLPGLGNAAFQPGHGSILTLTALTLVVVCAAAAYLNHHRRDQLVIVPLLLGMVPIGLGAAESIARHAPYLSFAAVAQFLETRLGDAGHVLFEGSAERASSLSFYSERGFSTVAEEQALERMAEQRLVYLIIHKDRVPAWQARLTERFHIYHQVTTCGSYAVVNNHP